MQESLTLKKQMIQLKNEYKDLSRLKWYINMAEDTRFLRGPLFKEETIRTSEETHSHETTATKPQTVITDETISH